MPSGRSAGRHPGALASIFEGARFARLDPGRFNRRRQSLADRLLGGSDGARGHADVKKVFERFASGPFGQAQFPGEVGDDGLKGGSLHPLGDSPRQLCHRPMGTPRANQAMQQVLDDVGMDRRNFRDLVPKRRRILSRKAVATALALLGLEGNDVVDVLHRHELVRGALVAGLTSRRPPTGRFGRTRGSRRRVTRRRSRGIPGVLVDPSPELLDLFAQCRDLGLELCDHRSTRSVYVVLGIPRLHSLMEHEREEKDSSEVNEVYELSSSGKAAAERRLTT